jgi:hypothetical protein
MFRRKTAANDSVIPAVVLSATMEGFGQAYNQQPLKAGAFFLAGLAFSTASGLNTWIARNVFRLPNVRIGSERLNLPLLALWAATYSLNLVDAWHTARKRR